MHPYFDTCASNTLPTCAEDGGYTCILYLGIVRDLNTLLY
uniref:Uncharacterized protein n=1 Tax=Arundo donax TaxID=35708 RepID=A0A0A9A174_ARUDO